MKGLQFAEGTVGPLNPNILKPSSRYLGTVRAATPYRNVCRKLIGSLIEPSVIQAAVQKNPYRNGP